MSSDDLKRPTPYWIRPRRLAVFGVIAGLFLLTAACSQGLQSTWDPAGPVAQKQLQLFNVLLWTMVAVFVLVEGAMIYIVIRYRRRPGQPRPPQIHGHTALEVTWTIIPTALILGLGIWSVFTLFELDQPPTDQGEILEVTVVGHQWFFEFEYLDADGNGKRISTANELRIPVDRPIDLILESDDVLHSFWVPKLGGKVDVVPTRQNNLWLMADSDLIEQQLPATYYGQCAELCGLAHAQMRFRVTVMSEEDYQSWVADLQSALGHNAPGPAGTDPVCHTLPAVPHGGRARDRNGGADPAGRVPKRWAGCVGGTRPQPDGSQNPPDAGGRHHRPDGGKSAGMDQEPGGNQDGQLDASNRTAVRRRWRRSPDRWRN